MTEEPKVTEEAVAALVDQIERYAKLAGTEGFALSAACLALTTVAKGMSEKTAQEVATLKNAVRSMRSHALIFDGGKHSANSAAFHAIAAEALGESE